MAEQESPDGEQIELDPRDFVQAVLGILPEDAAKVRERTSPTRKRPLKREGPTADHGDEADGR